MCELDQFLNIKVLQGSVLTHLRCDGIFNNQLITQSLLSLRVKKFENWSTFAEVMGNYVPVVLFMKHCVKCIWPICAFYQ